jgi:hypothetical protein
MENGRKVRKMDMEFGNLLKEIIMKEDGKIINRMVKEYSLMLEDLSTVDTLKIFLSTAEDKNNLLTEINLLANTNMASLMALEDTSGQMGTHTMVNSFKVREKAKEHLQIKMARFIEVILQMI